MQDTEINLTYLDYRRKMLAEDDEQFFKRILKGVSWHINWLANRACKTIKKGGIK